MALGDADRKGALRLRLVMLFVVASLAPAPSAMAFQRASHLVGAIQLILDQHMRKRSEAVPLVPRLARSVSVQPTGCQSGCVVDYAKC